MMTVLPHGPDPWRRFMGSGVDRARYKTCGMETHPEAGGFFGRPTEIAKGRDDRAAWVPCQTWEPLPWQGSTRSTEGGSSRRARLERHMTRYGSMSKSPSGTVFWRRPKRSPVSLDGPGGIRRVASSGLLALLVRGGVPAALAERSCAQGCKQEVASCRRITCAGLSGA